MSIELEDVTEKPAVSRNVPMMLPAHETTHASRRHNRLYTTGALVVLALMVVGIFMVGHKPKGGAPAAQGTAAPVVTVTTQAASTVPMRRHLVVTGTISAIDPLTIGAESTGLRINRTAAEEGDVVKKGQVLCELDNSVLRAQLAAMQAKLAESEAALSKTRQPNRPQDIEGLRAAERQASANLEQEQANLLQARANLVNAETNEKRYRALVSQGYVTQQETDDRLTTAQSQRALYKAEQDKVAAMQFALDQARQRLSLALEGGMRQDIDVAAATVSEMRANIAQLEAQIELTYVRAPVDGVILNRAAHVGDISTMGKTLFTMLPANNLELRAQVAEDDLPHLHVGQPVDIVCGQQHEKGKIWLVTPQVDASTRLGQVRIRIPSRRDVMPGMFVKGTIDLGEQTALVVPSAAIGGHMDDYFVYVYDQGHARQKHVQTGARQGGLVEITSGLRAGDAVIMAGAGFLADGDVVRLSDRVEKTPATADSRTDLKG
jgi:HlyD family secretion protein